MSAATITSIEKGTRNGHRHQIVKFAHGAETIACWGDDFGMSADGSDRWSVACTTHGYVMEFATYNRAKDESLQPGEWCTCCAEEIKAQAETVEAEEVAQVETVEAAKRAWNGIVSQADGINDVINSIFAEYEAAEEIKAQAETVEATEEPAQAETVETEESAQAETVEVEEAAQAFAPGDAVIATYKGAQTRGVIVCEYVCPDHRKGYPDERFYSSPEDPVYVVQERGEEREIAYRASYLEPVQAAKVDAVEVEEPAQAETVEVTLDTEGCGVNGRTWVLLDGERLIKFDDDRLGYISFYQAQRWLKESGCYHLRLRDSRGDLVGTLRRTHSGMLCTTVSRGLAVRLVEAAAAYARKRKAKTVDEPAQAETVKTSDSLLMSCRHALEDLEALERGDLTIDEVSGVLIELRRAIDATEAHA